MRVAIVGGGWSGLACAVRCMEAGHQITLFEAAASLGGRARNVIRDHRHSLPDGLDNGQHILIGAYSQCLRVMQSVGVSTETAMMRTPLRLVDPQGNGLALPRAPAPFNVLAGLFRSSGWSLTDKLGFIVQSIGWQWRGFECPSTLSVQELCRGLPPQILSQLIDPLCISALNTPSERASAQVFLRVLRDALFGGTGSSDLLLPRVGLSHLLPEPAHKWLQASGASIELGHRVRHLLRSGARGDGRTAWLVDGEPFHAVVLACDVANSIRLAKTALEILDATDAQFVRGPDSVQLRRWIEIAGRLQFEPITTVYLKAAGVTLTEPMLALKSDSQAPAQFAFDRGQLGGPPGLLALVASASQTDNARCATLVMAQARQQLGVHNAVLVKTIREKRATFACTPALVRPPQLLAHQLLACGDYVEGPYPATLEGAVRSGQAAADALG